MFTRREFVCVLVAFSGSTGLAAPPPSPKSVVDAFFRFHFTHDMGFTAKTLAARKKWLSPGLVAACDAYFKKPQPADEAPDIDGDPFTNSQDTPRTFKVRSQQGRGETVRVQVDLVWSKSERTTVTVVLIKNGGGWLIDDVAYPDGSTFRGLLGSTSSH